MDQLAAGGRMLVPVGQPYAAQELVRIVKDAGGGIDRRTVLPVAFVPLVSDRQTAT
ncbi:MAG: hypothetical protein ACTSRY_07400 [Alphaproteobacteria bacterium]